MYQFSSTLKFTSIGLIVLGLILFAIGFTKDSSITEEQIEQKVAENPHLSTHEKANSEQEKIAQEKGHHHHMELLEHQAHNKPWTALLVSAFLFTGIAMASFFFMSIQHASTTGWSIILIRLMENIASFMPYGMAIVFAILVGSYFGANHIYHWMDERLIDTKNLDYYDQFIHSKSTFLNKNFFLARVAIYFIGILFFYSKIKGATKKLDQTHAESDYKKLFNWAVGGIAYFAMASMAMGWDICMSIDPHWYSTLFGWYVMVSYLVCSIGVMIIISVYLKKQGMFPEFNDNHLHDLTKFMFGFSMLWSYLWFFQFMLIWYANIPEEVVYFQARGDMFKWSFLPMLLPNFLFPFLLLISSSMKRKYNYVSAVAVMIILGHYCDFYHIFMPGSVGMFSDLGFSEIGAFLFMLGLFTFIVMFNITKTKQLHKGNPYYHESEIYEYPF
jgi:hypothetical protein